MRKNVKGLRPRKVSETQIAAAAGRLTQRDRQIALDCYEHQVLTTEQLHRLHFTSNRATLYRLDALYEMRVLDRFRPYWQRGEGSTPYHWLLDETGAYIVAAEQRIERRELRWRHTTALGIVTSSTLRHRVETNEFITLLAGRPPRSREHSHSGTASARHTACSTASPARQLRRAHHARPCSDSRPVRA